MLADEDRDRSENDAQDECNGEIEQQNRRGRLLRHRRGVHERHVVGCSACRRAQGIITLKQTVVEGAVCFRDARSEEHTSELQSLMRISYAVFCLKKKKTQATQIE